MTDIPPLDQYLVLKSPQVTLEGEEPKKGRLKIFLGYCAGVGKTYRMLQEAINCKNNHIDVVIGIVETHGRKETENLVSALEIIPRKSIQYSGLTLKEMDLDAILARRPRLVLVDELAHTNLPGMRHTKRYQDVEELLNAGIDVFSTLNIQHVQSVIDIIYEVVNVKVEEVIPDRILELATEIELVDLPPEKLQQRLAEGKVYIPQKAKQAMQKFFKKGNLLALRELSLKYTAKRVDIDLLSYRQSKEISTVWPVESKLLVAISPNISSEKLLLIGHRMAVDLEAVWYAVHVESPQQLKRTEKARNQLYRNIHLAEELGAKVVTLSGNVVADELVKFAKQQNVTLIIAGLSQRSRLQELAKGSVLNKLVKESSPINVLVVGNVGGRPAASKAQKKGAVNQPVDLKSYIVSSLLVVLAALLAWLVQPVVATHNLLMIFLLPTIAAGILWGQNIGIFASLLAIAIFDFFFTKPHFSLTVFDHKILWSFAIFVLITVAVSSLGKFLRWKAENARHRERFILALHNFSQDMMIAVNNEDILKRAVKNISEAFESEVIILLPDQNGRLDSVAKNSIDISLNDMEKAVAMWSFKNGQPAGRYTSTLSSAKWLYLPLKVNDRILGIVCVMKFDAALSIAPEQRRLLESFVNVVALVLAKAKG